MIGSNAGLKRGKHKDLTDARDAPDCPCAIANIQALLAIKGDSRGDAHTFGVRGHGSVGSNAINRAVVPRRDIHLSFSVKSKAGGIHQLSEKRPHIVAGVNLEDRDRHLLSAWT